MTTSFGAAYRAGLYRRIKCAVGGLAVCFAIIIGTCHWSTQDEPRGAVSRGMTPDGLPTLFGVYSQDRIVTLVDFSASNRTTVHGNSGLSSANCSTSNSPYQYVSLQDSDETPGELLARGLADFQSQDRQGIGADRTAEFREAARILAQVIEHPQTTREQRHSAGFYRTAALSNAGRHQEAIQAGEWWMEEFQQPDEETILQIIAMAKWTLGQRAEAHDVWDRMLTANPVSPYKSTIERLLADPDSIQQQSISNPSPNRKPPYGDGKVASEFNSNQRDGYLVVAVGLQNDLAAHDGFREVAARVRQFHSAHFYECDGADFDALKFTIAKLRPRNVLFVIPPELLDVNFQRQVFLMSPTLDNDLAADFAWGYLTARDGEGVNLLWDRIERLHQQGLSNRQWITTAVAGGGMVSTRYENAIGFHQQVAGFRGLQIYFGIQTADPEVLTFVDKNLSALESASVISMSGNGDPQGIWLFDDLRNADRSKQWPFDPAKVGHDPNHEMLRIKADRFRKLKLNSPIIWSGTCHSGACRRVFVEADIVSTFGRSDHVVLYEMEPDEALSLALIDAGAAALLVPIASNHGMSAMMEQQFALLHGATLGEAIKSTYDDIFFQADGLPNLKLARVGDSAYDFGPIMQIGGSNRILIGDPALRVFPPTPVPNESTNNAFDATTGSLTVEVRWEKGFHVTGWNMYSEDRTANQRINTRIILGGEIQEFLHEGAPKPSVSAAIHDDAGNDVPGKVTWFVEEFGGERYLHLQAAMGRNANYETGFHATFTVKGSQ